jgi:hypothetical protein
VHEVGHIFPGYEQARSALLDHELGRSMMAEALRRGSKCSADTYDVDLLSMAEWELEDVRLEFGVPPLGSV